LCGILNVSRSGFYKWKYRRKNPSLRELSRQFDLKLIKEIHNKHKAHGYRWINAYLKRLYGVIFTDNYIHRLCKYENIKYRGKHYQWTKPDEEHKKFNNLIWNGWNEIDKPLQVIVSDMTSFYANRKYYELTMYFDVWNKEIIGYGLSSRKGDIKTYYDGLNQVLDKIKEEKHTSLVTLHTDQGSVYSSKQYNNLLNDLNFQRSMSRAGTPTDNPTNESLNGWIKEELFIDFDLKHSKDVPNLIKLYINYYNNERPAFSLNYKTPIQYKTELGY
jgi:transposase InsO family protein